MALPSFLFKKDNQIYVLSGFFASFIAVPLVIIQKKMSNSPKDLMYDNGIEEETGPWMVVCLMDILVRNIKKKVAKFTDD